MLKLFCLKDALKETVLTAFMQTGMIKTVMDGFTVTVPMGAIIAPVIETAVSITKEANRT